MVRPPSALDVAAVFEPIMADRDKNRGSRGRPRRVATGPGPAPDNPLPSNAWVPTTAPILLRLTRTLPVASRRHPASPGQWLDGEITRATDGEIIGRPRGSEAAAGARGIQSCSLHRHVLCWRETGKLSHGRDTHRRVRGPQKEMAA